MIRATIPRLTDIEDDVSLLVQRQYEENPFTLGQGTPIQASRQYRGLSASDLSIGRFQSVTGRQQDGNPGGRLRHRPATDQDIPAIPHGANIGHRPEQKQPRLRHEEDT